MAKDYKKEYKDLYLPKTKPMIIRVPEIQFAAVEGKGDPNDRDGEYPRALEILYGIQYTIKMSKMGDHKLDGYFDYVVPPLEGFWSFADNREIIQADKSLFAWTSLIRLPEFVDGAIFAWACDEVLKKKNIETKSAKLIKLTEGLCVQCMHLGSYDDEPFTITMMERFIEENNLQKDFSGERRHHEIYLSDPRKTEASKLKTVIRLPVKNI